MVELERATMQGPFTVMDSPDWGLVVVDSDDSVVCYFAYPDDPERQHYRQAEDMARMVAEGLNLVAGSA